MLWLYACRYGRGSYTLPASIRYREKENIELKLEADTCCEAGKWINGLLSAGASRIDIREHNKLITAYYVRLDTNMFNALRNSITASCQRTKLTYLKR